MGCNHGVPEAPVPVVTVSPPTAVASLEEGPSTLLGRIGDRSPSRSRGDKSEEMKAATEAPPRTKLELPLGKPSEEVRLAQLEIESLCRAVGEQLPSSGGHVCVLGGVEMHHPETKPLIQAVAQRLATVNDISVLTGGLPGVQEHMAKSLSAHGFQHITNLVHFGQERGTVTGEDLVAGVDAAERRKVFSRVGDVYLCFEGGPGVAEEAQVAFSRGARVVPMMLTGGASGGDFGFPLQALEIPNWCSSDDWFCLSQPGNVEEVADAVVRILHKALQDPRSRGGNARKMQDNSPDVVVTGPMCLVCGP